MSKRTPERVKFLNYLLSTAIEHGGYGFPEVQEWSGGESHDPDTFVLITDRYIEDETDPAYAVVHKIDLDTMARGLKVIREANSEQNQGRWVKDLLLADRTNGDEGDYDVIGALAVLECALFGEVVYA